ncbi:hypothetical protein [Pollutibacter soli]|uniref:hypothetical protein n=1 Tax=Pollutibacter soli TaxID=3034157 RepID=UPI00301333A0
MKPLVWIFGIVLMISCRKNDDLWINPPMKYRDLNNQVVGENGRLVLDLNEDGKNDFRFSEWEYASNAENAMVQEFYVFTYEDSYTLTSWNEFSQALNRDQVIAVQAPVNFEWANVSQTNFAKQIRPTGGPNTWLGPWKDVQHKFLPVQITIAGERHNGWIEISMDTGRKELTLHRAAWSEKSDEAVLAGR